MTSHQHEQDACEHQIPEDTTLSKQAFP